MTQQPPDPNDPDTEGSAVPPYEGRKEEATSGEGATTDDARTGGAVGPVDDPEPKAPDPEDTPGGATASPADEQPAADAPGEDSDDPGGTGPAHHGGTGRAEDQP